MEDYRRKGIGTKLMQEIIDYANKQKIKKLSLSVEEDNYSVRLYEKFGFVKVHKIDNSWTMLKTL